MFRYAFTNLTVEDYDSGYDTTVELSPPKVVRQKKFEPLIKYDDDPWINKLMDLYYTGRYC